MCPGTIDAMTVEQLRLIHPRFIYKRFDVVQSRETVSITYEFLIEPDIVFRPTVVIPYPDKKDVTQQLQSYAFHLGMIEAISYWKAACPSAFVVEAGMLTDKQIRFWEDLILHGLGEFFYRNEIDFTKEDFLNITSAGEKHWISGQPRNNKQEDVILVGGGKDSALTIGMLKQSTRTLQTMVLNPTKAALDTLSAAGLSDPIVVTRTIDPKLFELNVTGYLNGHTPFSAYLAFLGITVAAIYGNENVIVSNEKSANEGNVMYRGMEVNHQYSKSFRFETLFRRYAQETFPDVANYLSFLRPLNDVQISMLFSKYPVFFSTFRSCNVGKKTNAWCGRCPKCAFTYLTLFPFLRYEDMMRIFGRDYFQDPAVIDYLYAFTGLHSVKPFECVGTRDEAKFAVYLAVREYLHEKREVPEGLLKVKSDIGLTDDEALRLFEDIMGVWDDAHNLPPEYATLLRDAWERVLANRKKLNRIHE